MWQLVMDEATPATARVQAFRCLAEMAFRGQDLSELESRIEQLERGVPMPLSVNALKDRVKQLEARKPRKMVTMFYNGRAEARAKYADLVRQHGAANVVVVGWFKKGESSDQWMA